MSDWSSGYVIANGIRIHYHRTGGDKPALLIAHGITDNGLSWSRFARAMAPDYDVVLYDQRGHGNSDAPASGYTFADHAEDMAGLISALGLGRPHILGHSAGAVVAARLAAAQPNLPTSLILEDPAWGTAWGDWEVNRHNMITWFWDTVALQRQELVGTCRQQNPNWVEEDVQLWADSKVQVRADVVQTFAQPEPLWRDIVRQITCPILLIVGDPELGAIMTADDLAAVAPVWREGQAVAIGGAGHMVHYDRFAAFLAAVRTFLETW